MHYGQTLIDKVVRATGGSRYGICGEVDVDESFFSKVYAGKKPMPPLLAAKLAMLIGDDPRDAALTALVEGEGDSEERSQLRRWFELPQQDEPRRDDERLTGDNWRKR